MSLLTDVKQIDFLIRQLQKIESKLRAGQIIDAWRELTRVLALLQKSKDALFQDSKIHPEQYLEEKEDA